MVKKLINKRQYIFQVNDKKYVINYENKKIKNAKLLIKANKDIIVRGYNLSYDYINDFLLKTLSWIDRKIAQIDEKAKTFAVEDYQTCKIMYLLGKKYNVLVDDQKAYSTDGDILYVKSNDTPKMIFEKVEKIYQAFIFDFVKYYEKKFNIYPVVKFSNMQSKLGYCVVNKGILVFSRRIIHMSIDVIEYIVVHEFSHFLEANHQKQFYKVIETYLPDYKTRIKKMKTENILIKYKTN